MNHLYSFQSYNGWSWYGNGEADDYLTALVVHGLSIARQLGYSIDEERLERGIDALQRTIHSDRDFDATAYKVFVLAEADNPQPDLADELHVNMNALSPAGLAMSSLALRKMGKADKAQEVLNHLKEGLVAVTPTEMAWDVDASLYWQWNGTDVDNASWGLIALAALEPNHEAVPKIAQWLVKKRQGNRWQSTRSSATAIMALCKAMPLLESNESGAVTYAIIGNGSEILSGSIVKRDFAKPLRVSIDPALMKNGANQIELRLDPPMGHWSLNADLFYHGEQPYPINDDYFSIQRTYERAIHTKDYRGRPQILSEGIGPDEELDIGQEILVTLTIEAKRSLPYMIVEEPLPSGCEVIESFLANSTRGWSPYSRAERRDQKMVFFFDSVQQGATTVQYLIRAELPGRFRANPSNAWCMYYPEIQALGATGKIQVKKAG